MATFMISTDEYSELVYSKAKLDLLKETYKKYKSKDITIFLDCCRRTFEVLMDEGGEENEGEH